MFNLFCPFPSRMKEVQFYVKRAKSATTLNNAIVDTQGQLTLKSGICPNFERMRYLLLSTLPARAEIHQILVPNNFHDF